MQLHLPTTPTGSERSVFGEQNSLGHGSSVQGYARPSRLLLTVVWPDFSDVKHEK
jgi:hypothetical protein